MFEKTKTYCFGRYLVDVPIEAELKHEGNGYLSSAGIKSFKTTRESFSRIIDSKESELKNEKDKENYVLYDARFNNNKTQRLLVSSATRFGSTAYGIDSFKYLDRGYAVTTTDRSYGAQYIKSVITEFEDYLTQVRYRAQNEIPKEPGFCFENGFVANEGKTQQVEKASLSFELKKYPDVSLRILTAVYFKQEKSLLERRKSSGIASLFSGKIKTIRDVARVVNGIAGEESLSYFPSDDETGIAQALVWETLGEIGNPLRPSIHLEINTGELVSGETHPSSLTTKEAVALYEAIVKTIRIRPSN